MVRLYGNPNSTGIRERSRLTQRKYTWVGDPNGGPESISTGPSHETSAVSGICRHGAVAAGHPCVVETAVEILKDGGNAFDAALGAMCMSTVVEPVLCSLGGGGFLIARPVDGPPQAFDFFAQTPVSEMVPGPVDRDFFPIVADFGTAQQTFHIGLGAMATPGAVHGLFTAHEALGYMPMARLMAPAIALARDGYVLNSFQGYLFSVVGPIYVATAGARRIFATCDGAAETGRSIDQLAGGPDERLVNTGDLFQNPELADFLDALRQEGPRLFYEGEVGRQIVDDCRTGGGLLTARDLADYRTDIRAPLTVPWQGGSILTNPPPSTGGLLIGFALRLLEGNPGLRGAWGALEHMNSLLHAMVATNTARQMERPEQWDVDTRADTFLDPDLIAKYRQSMAAHPQVSRGTTHISVIDRAGNAASLTLSNGEGCGYVVPGTGVMMNNMLGEEDINPQGFETWPPNVRMGSMMAPTVLVEDGRLTVLGSGGSNRIRTAILQILLNLAAFGMTVDEAVSAPRLHFERGHLDLEPGWPEASVNALLLSHADHRIWPERNLFFGGVHLVRMSPDGCAEASGDRRRAGAAMII